MQAVNKATHGAPRALKAVSYQTITPVWHRCQHEPCEKVAVPVKSPAGLCGIAWAEHRVPSTPRQWRLLHRLLAPILPSRCVLLWSFTPRQWQLLHRLLAPILPSRCVLLWSFTPQQLQLLHRLLAPILPSRCVLLWSFTPRQLQLCTPPAGAPHAQQVCSAVVLHSTAVAAVAPPAAGPSRPAGAFCCGPSLHGSCSCCTACCGPLTPSRCVLLWSLTPQQWRLLHRLLAPILPSRCVLLWSLTPRQLQLCAPPAGAPHAQQVCSAVVLHSTAVAAVAPPAGAHLAQQVCSAVVPHSTAVAAVAPPAGAPHAQQVRSAVVPHSTAVAAVAPPAAGPSRPAGVLCCGPSLHGSGGCCTACWRPSCPAGVFCLGPSRQGSSWSTAFGICHGRRCHSIRWGGIFFPAAAPGLSPGLAVGNSCPGLSSGQLQPMHCLLGPCTPSSCAVLWSFPLWQLQLLPVCVPALKPVQGKHVISAQQLSVKL
jgi:hypothetical protein